MALTDDDLDRIGDKFKISLSEAFAEHMDKVHEKLYERISTLERALVFWRGALLVLSMAFSVVLAVLRRL